MCLSIHPSILSFPSPPGQTFDRNGNIALYLFTGRKVKVDLEEITQHAIAVEIQHVPLCCCSGGDVAGAAADDGGPGGAAAAASILLLLLCGWRLLPYCCFSW